MESNAYIIGDNKIGSELMALITPSDPSIEYTYQWCRSSYYDKNYEEIFSATDESYVISNSDKFLKCIINDGTSDLETNILIVSNEKADELENSNTEQLSINIGNGLSLEGTVSEVTGASSISTNINRINQSIRLILDTAYGEVPMMPSLGSNLYQFINDIVTDDYLGLLEKEIESALTSQEPRIEVTKVEANYVDDSSSGDLSDMISHTVYVRIEYNITGSNVTSSYIYTVETEEEEDSGE